MGPEQKFTWWWGGVGMEVWLEDTRRNQVFAFLIKEDLYVAITAILRPKR